MGDAKTITEHKAAFIRAQVRYLSAPLKPSPGWQSANPNNSIAAGDQPERPLSDKTVDEILNKLDAKIKTHTRNVFASQAQGHVAEQIDTLYWNEVAAENVQAEADTTWVKRNVDFTETETIQKLPDRYRDLHFHPDHQALDEDVKRYGEMKARLDDLVKERDEKKKRLETYRRLRELLKPLENAREDIQPNLVTRDGELSRELEKMKVLIARVTARLGQVSTTTIDDAIRSAQPNEDKLSRGFNLR